MPPHHHKKPDGGNDLLGKLLRSLPKKSAPWYFEAQLERKISGERTIQQRSPFLTPTFATTLLIMFGAGIFGYYSFFQNVPTEEGSILQDTLLIPIEKSFESPLLPGSAEKKLQVESMTEEQPRVSNAQGPAGSDPAIPENNGISVSPSFSIEPDAQEAINSARQVQAGFQSGHQSESSQLGVIFPENDSLRHESDSSAIKRDSTSKHPDRP